MSPSFTGRHAAAIIGAFFVVVLIVNLFMARMASATFGGVVVENSYVASQHFNRWLDEAAAEDALGWKADTVRLRDGRLAVSLSGLPTGEVSLRAVAHTPLGGEADRVLAFTRDGNGRFLSSEVLPPGRWRMRLEVRAGGKIWRSQGDIS